MREAKLMMALPDTWCQFIVMADILVPIFRPLSLENGL